ncbi:MAG: hypothetical protein RBQ94_06900 [Methanimicrococcus sp.]|nr:hypothetical protein [Methanimicrococcus sp.]
MKSSKTVGRLTLTLEEKQIGEDISLILTGGKAHIGAVSLAYFDSGTGRTTGSVISAPGHKEEEIALFGAKAICKKTKKTVLFAVGIHLDNITLEEIQEIEKACYELIQNYVNQ